MSKIRFYNPLDYLYYKIAIFNNRYGNSNWNIRNFKWLLSVYSIAFIVLLNLPDELYMVAAIVIILLIFMATLYVSARYRKIFRKYIGESETSRDIGNLVVGAFAAFPFMLLIWWIFSVIMDVKFGH